MGLEFFPYKVIIIQAFQIKELVYLYGYKAVCKFGVLWQR